MAETEMKQKVVKGLLWKLLENGGAQGVQFVIAIILARLLSPAESDPGPVRRCGNHHDFYHDCQRGGSEWFQHGSGTETEGRQGGFFIGLLF